MVAFNQFSGRKFKANVTSSVILLLLKVNLFTAPKDILFFRIPYSKEKSKSQSKKKHKKPRNGVFAAKNREKFVNFPK